MKILYAVQATGNGHIARAIELLPFLKEYGTVDVFLSGSNASLRPDLPVKFRSNGISLFYSANGKLDTLKILKQLNPFYLNREINRLPVEKYDLVISDFEFISARACKRKGKDFWHWGHQASFHSPNTPRPLKRDFFAEWIMQNYCSSPNKVGFHFKSYDDWILPPIIKNSLWEAVPTEKKHITVYLPHYSNAEIRRYFYGIDGVQFEVFSKECKREESDYNISWKPVGNEAFAQSMIQSRGIICGAGFETPAEALFLGKRLMVIPIQGQYEQYCNAAALEEFHVPVLERLDINFSGIFHQWLKSEPVKPHNLSFMRTEESVKCFMNKVLESQQ
jgi:uncharacterized protein (TIGR00661 family)